VYTAENGSLFSVDLYRADDFLDDICEMPRLEAGVGDGGFGAVVS
jgi:hypothetical protein